MFGWEEQVKLVDSVYQSLNPEQRKNCVLWAENYGKAGALKIFGKKYNLPNLISRHGCFWTWGYGNLTITTRENGKLVGINRSLTDFLFCTYLSDLAVDKDYQKAVIRKEFIRQTKLNAPDAKLILLSAPRLLNIIHKSGRHNINFVGFFG